MKQVNFYQKLLEATNNKGLVFKVAEDFSQVNIYIPKKIGEDHILADYGVLFVSFLEENYAGRTIYVPKFRKELFIENEEHNINSCFVYKLKSLIIRYTNFRK